MKLKSIFNPKGHIIEKVALGIIILSALWLRIIDLGRNPVGFFCDEASIGYNAYTILTSGKDEYGKNWPLFFRAFGEYKSPIMTYSTVPFVFLFGLNEFSVRLVSAIYGTLAVFSIYLLGKRLGGRVFGLVASVLLAISPWHIHFSRVSLEGLIPFTFFVTLATYYWPQDKMNKDRLTLSLILFVLAIYSYFPARLFIPPYCLLLFLTNLKQGTLHWRVYLCRFILTGMFLLPLLIHTFSGIGLSRWNQVKPESFQPRKIAQLYLSHFSHDFLFSKGDSEYPGQFITRHSVRGMGELYPFQLPLIVLSLFWIFIYLKKGHWITLSLVFWLALYPIGTIFTDVTGPQATRSIIGSIIFQLLSAAGFCFLLTTIGKVKLRWLKVSSRLILVAVIALVALTSFARYLNLLKIYPQYSSDFWGWQYGAKPVMEYFLANRNNYDQMCLEGAFNAPNIFIKFYDPTNKCLKKCGICGVGSFDRDIKQLFAITENTYKDTSGQYNYHPVKTIYYPNDKIAFYLVEIE